MVFDCQECGKKVEEAFQFCPFCGKKLIKPKICSNCGMKLKDNFKFCPECGKKYESLKKSVIPISKKTDTPAKVEETKPSEKPKPTEKKKHTTESKTVFVNILRKVKRPGKKGLLIIAIICIVLVVAAAVIWFNPFNMTSPSSGKTFTLNLDNFSDDVYYCFIVDGFPAVGSLEFPNSITADDSLSFTINENDLTIMKNTHSVRLFASIDAASWIDVTASGVTESASFEITDIGQTIAVNCTGFQ